MTITVIYFCLDHIILRLIVGKKRWNVRRMGPMEFVYFICWGTFSRELIDCNLKLDIILKRRKRTAIDP